MHKPTQLSIAALFFILLGSFYGCRSDEVSDAGTFSDQAIAEKYLTQHSSQYVSVKDGVTLQFRSDYTDIGRKVDDVQGVSISPRIAGEWQWMGDHSLHFTPEGLLDYDQSYSVSIDIDELLDIKTGDDIVWTIKTKPLRFNMSIGGLKIETTGGTEQHTLVGHIYSSDHAEPALIEGLLIATLGGSELPVSWTHTNAGKSHQYLISGIEPSSDQAKDLLIKWNGKKYDDSFVGDERIEILPKSAFQLIDTKLTPSPQRIITLYFNRPIDPRQNLKGLISINQHTDDLNTEVEGNVIYVYPTQQLNDEFALYVSDKIKSAEGANLDQEYLSDRRFEHIKPAVRALGSGNIIPNSQSSIFPIEVVNLSGVDIEIFKIFENNILQYLQENTLKEGYSLDQVGRVVHREHIDLADQTDPTVFNQWQRIGINLREYIDTDPGAIYQIRIGFQQQDVIYDCEDGASIAAPRREGVESMTRYPSAYYNDYQNRDNPCSPAYYSPDHYIRSNVLMSDIGVITKAGQDGKVHFAVSQLSTGQPTPGSRVYLYDYQQQLIQESFTSRDGLLTMTIDRDPFFAIVEDAYGYAYVKMDDQHTNMLSDFDISGTARPAAVNGYIYTERGVYRPGDTIHLNFILEDIKSPLPAQHPVSMTLTDPRGTKKYEETTTQHVGKIYGFHIPTDANGLTGQYRASIKVGPHQFTKNIRIETIKPNRLKVELDLPDELLYYDPDNREIALSSQWLHGAPASGLTVQLDAQMSNVAPTFDGYSDYSFMDPAKPGSGALQTLHKGALNEVGETNASIKIKPEQYPGKIRANLKTRVFERGGNFSENFSSVLISPFDSYVGIRAPENRWGYKSVKIGEDATFSIVDVADDGQPRANRRLSVGIYDIDWRWWYYEGDRYNIYRLNSAQHQQAFHKEEVKTDANGRYELTVDFSDVEYGRKLIRVCDEISGHCTGEFFYAQGWGRVDSDEQRESLAKLTFSSDKPKYKVGEQVNIKIPSEEGSKLLISVESHDGVLFQEWIDGQAQETSYFFEAAASMAPNVYAHVIMVQSYDRKANDLPIRMYGVIPIHVDNPKSHLNPQLDMTTELEPEQEFSISISEGQGRAMSYTVAIVDEGLLDLTNFSTPDPHSHFYAKQSLGVKTWDIYEDVLTGFSGEVDRIITVGGDGEEGSGSGPKKAIRFKPVVMTAGPFALKRGEMKKHSFTMPNYVGSVRAMVVARRENAYGHTDKTSPVKKAVMILPTMPRVLGPGEKVKVPMTIFAMDDKVRDVKVDVSTSDQLDILGSASQQLSFSRVGEQMAYVDIEVGDELGIARAQFVAEGGGVRATQEIEIDVRNPNPYESMSYDQVIQPGESWSPDYELIGQNGTNEAILELSAVPPMNLQSRLDYLMRYPYGCIEQTVSGAFPQLALPDLIDMDPTQRERIDKNVNGAIRRMAKMKLRNGGYSYWPGSSYTNDWSTSYAGHFLIKAKERGYFVADQSLRSWADHQASVAQSWSIDRSKNSYYQKRQMMRQAYRLYTLALYGSADLSAMNVLRQEAQLPNTARYMLAAAYAIAGNKSQAIELIENTDTDVKPYQELSFTYGSDLRDMALIAQALMSLDRQNEAGQIVKRIAERLNTDRWYSTQTVAQSLIAVSDLVGAEGATADMKFGLQQGDNPTQEVSYAKPIYSYTFDPESTDRSIAIANKGSGVLFAKLVLSGQPSYDKILSSPAYNRNITMSVNYEDLNGKSIDPSVLERGTDFIAHVSIKNQNSRGKELEELALSQIFPSGWEVQSGGLSNVSSAIREDSYEYRDVRDDRVYTFFDLGDRKDYRILLTAAYDGEYYLPPVSCEAMYDQDIQAKSKGMKVKVIAPK